MSSFYYEDSVAFIDDANIVGTIDHTWSDVDSSASDAIDNVYVHSSLPVSVRNAWFRDERLAPGYVLVEFMLPHDGFCLLAEARLRLLDRALTTGDVVKRHASDVQSGIVMSTSMHCATKPTCSSIDFTQRHLIPAQGHAPSHGPHAELGNPTRRANYGFPNSKDATRLLASLDVEDKPLYVPASEFKFWNSYREEDYLIYQDWLGCVGSVSDEVTIRLENGSVVVVEDPHDLEEPFFIPGSTSYELAQRLDRLGFYLHCSSKNSHMLGKPNLKSAEACFPGQRVQTKKGNLRRGRWIYGAYDPNVEPQGIVVDVRIVELAVAWLSPNLLDPSHKAPPPEILDTDVLDHGGVIVLNRSQVPRNPMTRVLPGATYGPDTGFGSRVRFKDPSGAALKYRDHPGFSRRARADTQGYDLNVMHITSTKTTSLVRWQDGSYSQEDSISVFPCLNLDEHDVWPGDKVSLRADEEIISGHASEFIRAHSVGVVQKVNAEERLARVRWFQDAMLDINNATRDWCSASSTWGTISNRETEVAIYDVATYPAFEPRLGEIAIAFPEITASIPRLIDILGEVVELCLDGQVIVRCGATNGAEDVKKAIAQLAVVASGRPQDDSDYDMLEDDEEDWSDDIHSTSDDETSQRPIDVQIEYEGGEKMDTEDNEDVWSTDEDIETTSTHDDQQPPAIAQTLEQGSTEVTQIPRFIVLENEAPDDHHFIRETYRPTSKIMQRIMKEHRILQSSLPDRVYVRAWENRLDILRILFIGPNGTPYEHAPFVFDMYFDASFPESPPQLFFHSWTNGLGRVNPNLYEDGKVCLSVLGTWPADERNEGWSSKNSTVLQILVSIQGLVLVKEPYFNEAGFDVLVGSDESRIPSRLYTEKAYVMCKSFVKHAILNPPMALKSIIAFLYISPMGPQLLRQVSSECQRLCSRTQEEGKFENGQLQESKLPERTNLSTGALVLLRRHLEWMLEYLGIPSEHLGDSGQLK